MSDGRCSGFDGAGRAVQGAGRGHLGRAARGAGLRCRFTFVQPRPRHASERKLAAASERLSRGVSSGAPRTQS